MQVAVYNNENKEVDKIDIPNTVFKAEWKPDLVHQVITSWLSSRRKPFAHTKDRSEVRGGGKKPWRQKGTGRARAGSIRSPLWRGGGVTFGPTNEKNFNKKINKKMRKQALFSVLSKKLADGEIKVVDTFGIEDNKTKKLAKVVEKLTGNKDKKEIHPVRSKSPKATADSPSANRTSNGAKKSKPGTLLIPPKNSKNTLLAGRNIPKNKVSYPNSLNTYDCLAHKFIFFEKEAINQFIKEQTK